MVDSLKKEKIMNKETKIILADFIRKTYKNPDTDFNRGTNTCLNLLRTELENKFPGWEES
jgi:hypothetical protein